jgi:hypothetical protein
MPAAVGEGTEHAIATRVDGHSVRHLLLTIHLDHLPTATERQISNGTLKPALDQSGIWEVGSLTVSGERAGAASSPAARAATTSLFGTPLRPSPPPPPRTAIGSEGVEGEEPSASASAAGGSGLMMWASGSQAAQ